MTRKYYLGIDIGASSGRHLLAYIENGKLRREEIYRFENGFGKKDGSFVWDIRRLETEVKTGIKKCAELRKIPVSVAIDTWGIDYVLLDERMKVMEPVYSYRDKRTFAVINELERKIPFRDLYASTGIQKLHFNTIYQLYCDKVSGRLNQAKRFLMIPDYLSYLLTGTMANEYTNATTTGMVNAVSKGWDENILRQLDYPSEIFSPLLKPCTYLGEFTKEVQDYCGFRARVILAPSHDTASAVAGLPLDNNSAYISSGTWSLIGTELKDPILSDRSRIANFTNEGGINYRFRYLKNYMGMWLFQNIRRNLDKGYSYDQMMRLAEESSCVRYFDVNDDSLLTPDNMIAAVNSLLGDDGLPLGDTLNCVYHSLAKSYHDAVGEIERQTGKNIENIFIVGGGSKDTYLNRLTASYTGKKVYSGLTEATATGNLITQIMADEGITLAQARELVFASCRITEVN